MAVDLFPFRNVNKIHGKVFILTYHIDMSHNREVHRINNFTGRYRLQKVLWPNCMQQVEATSGGGFIDGHTDIQRAIQGLLHRECENLSLPFDNTRASAKVNTGDLAPVADDEV